MTRKGRHSSSPASGISDEDLLDLIEGRLPLERIQELEPALRADPALHAKVRAMARDRELLESTAGEAYNAPSGVLDGALERAEREALAEVASSSTPAGTTMPRLIGTIAAGLVIALSVAFVARYALFDDEGGSSGGVERYVRAETEGGDVSTQGVDAEGDTASQGAGQSTATGGEGPSEASGAPSSNQASSTDRDGNGALREASLAEASALLKEGRLRLVVSGGEVGAPTRLFADVGRVRASDGAFVTPEAVFASSFQGVASPGGVPSVRHAETLAPGAYDVRAELGGDGALASIVRELEARGAVVRVERAEDVLTPGIRVEDVLWWSPRRVEMPTERVAFRLIVE